MLKCNLKEFVESYRKSERKKINLQLDWFKSLNLKKAVEKASLAINGKGKRFSHQHRISPQAVCTSGKKLCKNIEKIRTSQDFAELHQIISDLVKDIKGLGELYKYDTALRIGSNLRKFPKNVYIHAGTRQGARILNLKIDNGVIVPKNLPKELNVLKPYEIEDFLCIYKDCFSGKKIINHKNCK